MVLLSPQAEWFGLQCLLGLGYVSEIVAALEKSQMGDNWTPLQKAELSLLYAYLAQSDQLPRFRERSVELLNEAIDSAADIGSRNVALWGGLPNLGWLATHISNLLELCPDVPSEATDDPLSDLDGALLALQEKGDPFYGSYDLIGGLVGMGLYWLERRPAKRSDEGINRVVCILRERAEVMAPGLTWFTSADLVPPIQRPYFPEGYYNLGMAHGIIGVLAFLARVAGEGIDSSENVQTMLHEGLRWFLAQTRSPDRISRFSSWMSPGHDCGDSRLGWCYGDLGIGIALQNIGTLVGDERVLSIGERLLDRCLEWPLEQCHVNDAGLCHGAFGVAHIYNRAFQRCGKENYLLGSRRWFEIGMELRDADCGAAGFYTFDPAVENQKKTEHSILSGSIGVALALLAATNIISPGWDRQLLVSSSRGDRKGCGQPANHAFAAVSPCK